MERVHDQHTPNTLLSHPYVISLLVGTLVKVARLVSHITFLPRGVDMDAYSIVRLLLFDMIIYLCGPSAPLSTPPPPSPTRVSINIWRRPDSDLFVCRCRGRDC